MIVWKKADINSIKVALSGSIKKSKDQIAEKIAKHLLFFAKLIEIWLKLT